MSVPQKYQPEPKRYEKKHWLYEQYWGQLLSQNEIADTVEVSRKKIRMEMDKHGIPTRSTDCNHDQANPFSGFYNPTERPPAPENTQIDDRGPKDEPLEPDPSKWSDASSSPMMWISD